MATDLEKRLRLLRQQIYGREIVSTSMPQQTKQQATEIAYLYHDLAKIGILASLAIGTQIILFNLKLF